MNDIAHLDDGEEKDRPSHDQSQQDPGQQGTGRRRDEQVLDERQCLAGLSRLPGLLAMGMIKPGQANAMRGALKDLLQYHLQTTRGSAVAGLKDDDVLTILSENPEYFSALEAFLTDDQIKLIMKKSTNRDA